MTLPTLLLTLMLAGPSSPDSPVESGSDVTVATVDRVRLEVDHSALLDKQMVEAAEDSAYFVRTDGAKALSEGQGVEVVEEDDAPAIIVKLAWKDYQNSVYFIEIATRQPGEPQRLVESFEATCINNTALTEVVLAKLPAALEQLSKPIATAEPDPSGVEPLPETPPTETTDPVDDRKRASLGPMGKAGVGLVVAGVIGVGTGAVVFGLGERFETQPNRLDEDGKNYRPPGGAVLGVGGAVLVTGAVLLIVDRVQARRQGKSPRRSARLIPTPTGFAVGGRF